MPMRLVLWVNLRRFPEEVKVFAALPQSAISPLVLGSMFQLGGARMDGPDVFTCHL